MSTKINEPKLIDTAKGFYDFSTTPHSTLGIVMQRDVGPNQAFIEVLATGGSQLRLSAGGTNWANLTFNATSWSFTSDERLKNIVDHITDPLTKINTLRPIRFCFKSDKCNTCIPTGINDKGIGTFNCECSDKCIRHGLIAQDVQNIYPELVSTDQETGYLSMGLTSIIPLLTSGIKELRTITSNNDTTINLLKTQLTTILERINVLENNV